MCATKCTCCLLCCCCKNAWKTRKRLKSYEHLGPNQSLPNRYSVLHPSLFLTYYFLRFFKSFHSTNPNSTRIDVFLLINIRNDDDIKLFDKINYDAKSNFLHAVRWNNNNNNNKTMMMHHCTNTKHIAIYRLESYA